jgi:hypothetical protein
LKDYPGKCQGGSPGLKRKYFWRGLSTNWRGKRVILKEKGEVVSNIGLEWWILYVEIAFIGIAIILHLRDICENTERGRR